MTAKLGTLTIGQAPRADMTPILDAVLRPDVPRIHAGVLDGLTRDEIAARFGPGDKSQLLITRLLDGTSVVIDHDATEAGAEEKVASLEAQGCTAILMLCTGTFHKLKTKSAWLLEPERLLPRSVAALVGDRQLGIIVPLPEQIESESGKWAHLERSPIYAAGSPYSDDRTAVPRAAQALRAQGAEVLLMDCMGFTHAHKDMAVEASQLPVILSNALVAKLVSELL
ncbi:AroM family protein [Microvirga splendida]|uniref:AroM family protein n=1 Tax=Microvirga splendida TaxID=2795727 RepID=A0ABS0Y5G8_9HYPH|nr:AroM family protein [Microvirga splendida]MBJ6127175.1 AroM family protein [Microvirga splendida]